jgi:hypothetical protein
MLNCFVCSVEMGLFLITAGILCVTLFPWLIEEAIRSSVKMETPTSSLYDSFKNSSAKGVEEYKTYYLFHITNPWAVQNLGAIPHLEKRGPFVYREYETFNESVTAWHPNATFTYRSFTTYAFQPAMSADDMQVVTIPRGSYFAIIKIVKFVENKLTKLLSLLGNSTTNATIEADLGALVMTLLNDIIVGKVTLLQNTSVFVNATVRDIMRNGYDDDLVTQFEAVLAKVFANQTSNSSKKVKIALLSDTTPEEYDDPSLNNIAYTGGQPSSTQPPIPDHAYRKMTQWHGSPTVSPYWGTEEANQIGGTDGTAFHPMIKKDEALEIFVGPLVRKVRLTYQKEVMVKGVKCYRHIIDPTELLASPRNAEAYYMSVQGWLPTSPRQFFLPVTYTKALFLDAQIEGVVNVTGLEADMAAPRDQLETYLDIEPMTGGLFQVHKRLQANVQLAPMSWDLFNAGCLLKLGPCNVSDVWAQTKNLPTTMIPMTFLDQSMLLPDSIVQDLKDLIFTPLLIAKVMGGIGIAVGTIIIILASIALFRRLRRQRNEHVQSESSLQLVNGNSQEV